LIRRVGTRKRSEGVILKKDFTPMKKIGKKLRNGGEDGKRMQRGVGVGEGGELHRTYL